jgi:hypothetical protein
MMAAAAATAAVVTLVIAVAPPHALVLSVSHDCLLLTPVNGDCGPADSSTQLQAKSHTAKPQEDELQEAKPLTHPGMTIQ